MLKKELIEARWKTIICGLLALLLVEVSATTYGLFISLLKGPNLEQMPAFLQQQMTSLLSSYDLYLWGNWFAKNGTQSMAVMAAILGASLIAGETSRGTIFFLLGKPVSRERVLLTKYAISALLLLVVIGLSSVALLVTAVIVGHPQSIVGVLTSTVLLWLGVLMVLGLALLFSVLFHDVLRPLLCALGITLLLALPGFFPNGSAWSVITSWSSQTAYLGQAFPLKEGAICLLAALIPLLLALVLFHRRAY